MEHVYSELDRIFSTWSGLASQFIGACFDHAKPFIDRDVTNLDPYIRFVSAQLYTDCHLTSESVLILVREAKEWDADLLNRSVIEGSLKYVYMFLGSAQKIRMKVEEYWELLPSFAAIKHSERVKRFLEEIPNTDSLEWQPFRELILADGEIEAIRKNYTRNQRKELEERWSFSGISRQFMQSEDKGLRLFGHLAHGYGMSSHLLHKDADGVGMVWERYGRDPHRQTAVRLAHSARIISDVCTLAKLRLLYLLKVCDSDTGYIRDLEKQYESLFDDLTRANSHFSRIEYDQTS